MKSGYNPCNTRNKSIKDHDVLMNEELQKWLKHTKENIRRGRQDHKKKNISKNKPSGKCQICGEKDAKFVCLKCGKSVCSSCYFKIIGICKKCVPKNIAEKWEGKYPDWERVLGVKWVD